MKFYGLLSIVLLGVLLVANAAPIPSHAFVARGAMWNTVKQAVSGKLGKVSWMRSGPKHHPVVQTGGGKHPDDVAVAQASHKLPKKLFPHQEPSQNVVPSAKLQQPTDPKTSFINTGKPTMAKQSQLRPDPSGRKANLWDVTKLKFKQWKNRKP